MTSTILAFTPKETINSKHRKENRLHHEWQLFDIDTCKTLVTIRTYWPNEVCYACVWIYHQDQYATGSSKTGGGGCDKVENCVKHAFLSAGVHLEKPFNENQPRAILEGLAKFWGLQNYHIFEAYG